MEGKLFEIEIDNGSCYYAYAYDENECFKLLYDLGAFLNGFNSVLINEVTQSALENSTHIDEDSGLRGSMYDFIEVESSMFSKSVAIEYC